MGSLHPDDIAGCPDSWEELLVSNGAIGTLSN